MKGVLRFIVCGVWVFVLGCDDRPAPAVPATSTFEPAPALTFAIDPTRQVAATEALLARGGALYVERCAACHGDGGEADGPATYLLYPKPRNFKEGPYRFVSTWDGLPTDRDLYRVISRGIPGSAMPSWAHMSEDDRWALVHFVKSFGNPIEIPAAAPPVPAAGELGQGVIEIPTEPKNDEASLARGEELFAQACAACHGDRGRGDGPSAAVLKDSAGLPIRPRDLASGVFKGPRTKEDLFRRITGGIPGSGMPAQPMYWGDDAWHLVHYVRSLSGERLQERAEMKRFRIVAPRVDTLPDHPDAGVWGSLPEAEIHLMPLWWRYDRPHFVTVNAVHDGKELAVLLSWDDDTQNQSIVRTQDFRDAAAIQFAKSDAEPFFAMGRPKSYVNIWMWKAEREADLKGFHDVEWQYPNVGIDSYPNLQDSPYEQPMRDGVTLRSDPTFITAWGAGNIVSDPTRRSAVEDLQAEGFGTLRSRGKAYQTVDAHGVHNYGSYRVMFRRALGGTGANAVSFAPGQSVVMAVAVWNGDKGDRDGQKSVSIWQELALLP